MDEFERCRHPDCIYRNHGDPAQTGNCNHALRTGMTRTARIIREAKKRGRKVKEEMLLPCNCPFYKPDGITPPEQTTDWREEALVLYRAGKTDKEIAEALGLTPATIQGWRSWRRLPVNKDVKGPQTKYDWKRAEELWRKGMSDGKIAEALGCTVSSVLRWRNKQNLVPNFKNFGRRKERNE